MKGAIQRTAQQASIQPGSLLSACQIISQECPWPGRIQRPPAQAPGKPRPGPRLNVAFLLVYTQCFKHQPPTAQPGARNQCVQPFFHQQNQYSTIGTNHCQISKRVKNVFEPACHEGHTYMYLPVPLCIQHRT
ncbi:hypothetical protein GE21DRAFT_1099199 [Neurospora crassa]|nr:hypothetical protein GE21DRAFT_1099199 [Neurospora crassa]